MTRLPLNVLSYEASTWPRYALSEERVTTFAELLQAGEELPPIEVVAQGDGTFHVADGVHRAVAAGRLGRGEIDVILLAPSESESPTNQAYRRALETASRSALPLNRLERRRAVKHLIDTRPDLSHREISRLVSVAHSTVDRWAEEYAKGGAGPESVSSETPAPSSPEVAKRFVRYLGRLDNARGLLDMFVGRRMYRHVADAFVDEFGSDAVGRAQLILSWIAGAVELLEGES